jgi:hypothetical protein
MAQQKMCKTKANVGLFFQLGRPSSSVSVLVLHHAAIDNERGFSLYGARDRDSVSPFLRWASENCVRYLKRCESRLVMDRIVVPCVVSNGNQTGERNHCELAGGGGENRKEEAGYINKLGNNHNNSASVLFLG